MITPLIALALAGGQSAPPPLPDWAALGPLRYLHDPEVTPAMTQFVADEVAAGRCAPPRGADGRYSVTVDVAVLVDAGGKVRQAVPHAIDCPTVEQYGAGLVTAFARDNLVPRAAATDQWFRTSVTFGWTK
jgi:hypothetical protein